MAGGALIRDALMARIGDAGGVGEVFAAASERLRRFVPYDAAVWLASDPATGLPTAPTRAENMGGFGIDACLRGWELEYTVEDVNRYSALARAATPAAGLRMATGDRPARSTRYRDVLAPHGFGDELRAVMRADGSPWGLLALFRADGSPPFDAAERDSVAGLSDPLGDALRDRARPVPGTAAARDHRRGPGLMLFSPDGELLSVNDDARAWLDELPVDTAEHDAFAVPLPIVVVGTLMRARAIAAERDGGSARARIRSRAGGWLVCHASCLRDADGRIGDTALVIEPASASEILPLLTEACDLTPREQEITRLIARGLGTAAIARRLFLSAHTVRDYVKSIFEKVGVSTRGELVARLFAEHYAPAHVDPGGVERFET